MREEKLQILKEKPIVRKKGSASSFIQNHFIHTQILYYSLFRSQK